MILNQERQFIGWTTKSPLDWLTASNNKVTYILKFPQLQKFYSEAITLHIWIFSNKKGVAKITCHHPHPDKNEGNFQL